MHGNSRTNKHFIIFNFINISLRFLCSFIRQHVTFKKANNLIHPRKKFTNRNSNQQIISANYHGIFTCTHYKYSGRDWRNSCLHTKAKINSCLSIHARVARHVDYKHFKIVFRLPHMLSNIAGL